MKRRRAFKDHRLFMPSDPLTPRLSPALAKEIGLNESIIFLQLEFWLIVEGEEKADGDLWVRKPVREISAFFSFWSVQTAQRAIESLSKAELITIAEFDEGPGRSARWLKFNIPKLAELKSIRLLSQIETFEDQSETETHQNETPGLFNSSKSKDRNTPQRGTRITKAFQPDQDVLDWAKAKAPHVDVTAARDEFVDYWIDIPGRAGLKLNWQSTFRNRLRTLEARTIPNGATRQNNSNGGNAARANHETSRADYDPFKTQRTI